jgi:hypothetical protein
MEADNGVSQGRWRFGDAFPGRVGVVRKHLLMPASALPSSPPMSSEADNPALLTSTMPASLRQIDTQVTATALTRANSEFWDAHIRPCKASVGTSTASVFGGNGETLVNITEKEA